MSTIKTTLLVSLAALGMMMSSCSKDDFQPQMNGEVQISFQAPVSEGGRIESVTPANVVVTIEDALGVEVYTLEKMPLIEFSGAYVTAPIALSTGNYKITEFLVTDSVDATIFATPISGSDVAYLVSNALDIDFTITADQVTSLSPEVLSTALLTAGDFGYASLSFTTVETFDILLSALRYVTLSGWTLTDASIVVEGDGVEIVSRNIASATTQITVNDGYTSYEVIVSKTGYTTVSGTFTNAQMKTFFDSPLIAQLTAE